MKIIKSDIKTQVSDFTPGNPREQCLFFDIETTGLSPRASSLYLIGALSYSPESQCFHMIQWFADKHRDEAEIIRHFLSLLERYSYLYHFNGRTFDIPYLLHKCSKYQIGLTAHTDTILRDKTGLYSIDLLARIRPLKKLLSIEKARQTDLEHWLGHTREDTYSGGDLIPVYSQYMQDQLLHPEHARELERFLLLHNHDDMEGMLIVSQLLNYSHLLTCPDGIRDEIQVTALAYEEQAGALHLSFTHPAGLPKNVSITKDYPANKNQTASGYCPDSCTLLLEKEKGTLKIPVIQAELKYFLPNPKDYYYLPAEDQAVHKSIGEFVEASHRQKATAANCYLRRSGTFLPSLHPYSAKKEPADTAQAPLFLQTYRDKLCFYQLPEPAEPAEPFWKEYLLRELAAFLSPSAKNTHQTS